MKLLAVIKPPSIYQCVKVNILYKAVMDSNAFLFESARPIIYHSQVHQAQAVYMYVQVAPH